jgi:ubiquinone/menaquinone biosynthesis C-methylase UbiE
LTPAIDGSILIVSSATGGEEFMQADVYKEKSKKQFDGWAGNYGTTHTGSNADEEITRLIDGFACESLLDVGCGDGRIMEMLWKEGRKTSGIDISAEMIKQSGQRLAGKARLVVGDSEFLPWPDREFDAVMCTASFHHYPRPMAVLKEMLRVLKPNGLLLIVELNFLSPIRVLANVIMPFLKYGVYHFYSRREMERLFRAAGVKDLECRKLKGCFILYTRK